MEALARWLASQLASEEGRDGLKKTIGFVLAVILSISLLGVGLVAVIFTVLLNGGIGDDGLYYFPMESTVVTDHFGPRKRYQTKAGWTSDFHNGTDFPSPEGTPIYACRAGIVIVSVPYSGTLVIEHEDGSRTRYFHCSDILVEQGEDVDTLQEVALVGQKGKALGPHLHLEMVTPEGEAVDALDYLEPWPEGFDPNDPDSYEAVRENQ